MVNWVLDTQMMYTRLRQCLFPTSNLKRFLPAIILAMQFQVRLKTNTTSHGVDDGSLWTWGANDNGQLGLGHTKNQLFPQRTPLKNVVDCFIGGTGSAAWVLTQREPQP
jgi:alpha-tubulin suppressor-like RCC1 family protein